MKSNNFYKTYPGLFIIFMALFSVAIHLLVANNLEYNRDEMLYFTLGQHPAFGYASVPPMIGWIAWLMEHILRIFVVRGSSFSCPAERCYGDPGGSYSW